MSNISYKIFGSDLQFVELLLPSQNTVLGEQGAMMYMDNDIQVNTILGDGSASRFGLIGRMFKAVKRSFTGESLFSSRYYNPSATPKRIAFSAPGISKIVAIDLDGIGGEIICQRGAYLAGEEGIQIKIALQKRLRVGILGGENFIMQRITGKGLLFANASGALVEMQLNPGELLKVDSGSLMALTSTVNYDIKYVGKIKTALFGGEGLFYCSLAGPGKVWLQSLPENRLAAEIINNTNKAKAKSIWGRLSLIAIIIGVVLSLVNGK